MKSIALAAALTLASLAAHAGTAPIPSLPGSSGTVAPTTGVKAMFGRPSFVGSAPPGVFKKLLTVPEAVVSGNQGLVTVPVRMSNGDIVLVTMDASGRIVSATR